MPSATTITLGKVLVPPLRGGVDGGSDVDTKVEDDVSSRCCLKRQRNLLSRHECSIGRRRPLRPGFDCKPPASLDGPAAAIEAIVRADVAVETHHSVGCSLACSSGAGA